MNWGTWRTCDDQTACARLGGWNSPPIGGSTGAGSFKDKWNFKLEGGLQINLVPVSGEITIRDKNKSLDSAPSAMAIGRTPLSLGVWHRIHIMDYGHTVSVFVGDARDPVVSMDHLTPGIFHKVVFVNRESVAGIYKESFIDDVVFESLATH